MAIKLQTLPPKVQPLHRPKRGGWSHERTARERGYGWAWAQLRERVLARDCGLCQPCLRAGRVTAAREVDHVLSKAQGGDDDMGNLQSICVECHQRKTSEETGRRWRAPIGVDGWPAP